MNHPQHAESLWAGPCEQQQTNKDTIAAEGSVHHAPKEGWNEKDLPQETSQQESYDRFIHADCFSDDDEVKDHWEQGRDEDSPSDKMAQGTNYERFINHDYLSDVDMEEDRVNMPPI